MATLSDDGFTEILIAGGCAAALVASWIIGTVLIFFPRHETETYRRRLVANMPRARDETLPPELQLQSTIDSISMATTIPGQSPVDATKDDEQLQDNPFEEDKASEKEDSKVQQNQEKKSKPPVPKVEQQPEKPPSKKKEKPPAVEKKREKPAAEKKPAKASEKKYDEKKDDKKKGKEEKPKEKDKKKK